MALPAPKTHWRLSEIAEELENLDMSLDMDFSKDMDQFFRGSSLESDSISDRDCDKVELRKPEKVERKKSQVRTRTRMAPNVPPPPPPTQVPNKPPSTTQLPATAAPSSTTQVNYVPASIKVPAAPTTPVTPLTPTAPVTPRFSYGTPPTLRRSGSRATPPSTPPPPVPESPAPLPPPMMEPRNSHLMNGVSVLPPLPKLTTHLDDTDDLPPPPPLFDLPEPNYAPPSPCTSPLVLSNEQPPFRASRLTSPSPLTFSDSTSGYSTSCASSVVTSCPERSSAVYAPTSVASTSSDQPSEISDDNEPVFEKITDDDIQQVEMFYRSHQAHVFVCPGIANLYFGPARQDGIGEKWELSQTGIPVLLMDTGDARRQRKIQIILAEKGSGFMLWKDNIDQLSNFKSVHSNFQSMYLSNDHTKLAGLSYDDENAASEFLTNLLEFTSDPNDEALRMGKNRKKKKAKKQKYKAPKKTDISQPCGFVHVTKLDRADHDHIVQQNTTPVLATRNPNNILQ